MNHDINAYWPRGHGAKQLPHHALHSITVDRPPRNAPAGDDSDASMRQAVGLDVHGEIASRPRFTGRQRRCELLAPLQAGAPRQRKAPLAQALNRVRPLARRARNTPRPPRVRMRARKPCVRLRRFTEGWYVRFMGSVRLPKSALLQPLTPSHVNHYLRAIQRAFETPTSVDKRPQKG